VTAVVWVDANGGTRLLDAVKTPEGEAMGSFLVATAPDLASFAAPTLLAARGSD